MPKRYGSLSRRGFLRTATAAGAAAMLNPPAALAAAPAARVPQRPFGKTGLKVPILSLGGMFDIPSNQLMLRQAMRLGVTYWDTAESYGYGNSESGIGKYFQRFAQDRQKVFLVTKSSSQEPSGLAQSLSGSLERLNTDYIDLFFVHAISSPDDISRETLAWGRAMKKAGKIRLFGFSTHSNMADCLAAAPKMGGIDGIMFTYNFRVMGDKDLQAAVEACHRAGIGLTAMKTQASRSWFAGSGDVHSKMLDRFIGRGFTDKQANLKVVWEDRRIAAICSQMPSLTILLANAAAALDKKRLSAYDRRLLDLYAAESRPAYCAGCAGICAAACGGQVPVAQVMRYLMYAREYGDEGLARGLFAELPAEARQRLGSADYSLAERRCPQGMPIARLMREAQNELGA